MTDTITLPRSVIEQAIESLQGYARETCDTQPCDAEKALRAALAQQTEQVPNGFEKYLKEGEAPLQRLEREIKDGRALMKIYGKALTQIQELQAEQGWQPIDTAPKDGTEVLLGHQAGTVVVGYWSERRKVFIAGDEDASWSTYWMPLPAAPKGG